MAKKSLLKNLTGLFKKKNNNANISASEAISLQQEYVATFCDVKDKISPPYLVVCAQLNDKNPEIATAAAYYLKQIVENHPQFREGILVALQEYLQHTSVNEKIVRQLKEDIEKEPH